LQGKTVSVVPIWREHRDSHESGVVQLVDFAIRLFSPVLYSAATERLFSLFGIIHTNLRDRLHAEKVRKYPIVRADTMTQYGEPRPGRRKRRFTDVRD
jgi:hypothetical protein